MLIVTMTVMTAKRVVRVMATNDNDRERIDDQKKRRMKMNRCCAVCFQPAS